MKWFDNNAGAYDFVNIHKRGYEHMNLEELEVELKKERIARNEHTSYFNVSQDMEAAKAIKRCTNRIRVIRQFIAESDTNTVMHEACNERIKKLKNTIHARDLRIDKLLREVERYKKLAGR